MIKCFPLLIRSMFLAAGVLSIAIMSSPHHTRLAAEIDASAEPNAGWQEVGAGSASGGGISDNDTGSVEPAIAFDSNNMPYVAWQETSGDDGEIYVRRWDGSAWQEVGAGSASGGGISDNDEDSQSPSIALSPWDTPYVAWSDWSSVDYSEHVYVYRWIDGLWESVGQGAVSADLYSDFMAGSHSPQLAIAPDGTLYVVWFRWDDNASSIYVRRWTGSIWETVGSGSLGGGGINEFSFPFQPAIAAAPDSTVYVAWLEAQDTTGQIYVLHWDGSAWVEVGAGSASGGGISNSDAFSDSPSIAVAPDGTPYVAWKEPRLTITAEMGKAAPGTISHVARQDNGYDTEIYVRRWNGSTWEEVGSGSASGGGISDNASLSYQPSIAITPDGTPYVAWCADDNVTIEIYVRRWTGSAWEEVGAGSASGGGVSDTANARSPSIAIASGGKAIVAWGDGSDGDGEIYVRQWDDTVRVYLPLVLNQPITK